LLICFTVALIFLPPPCFPAINIRPETLKLVHERAGNALELIGKGNDFLNRTQVTQQLRERIDKWDYMKLKSF
jgi:hypothetical protein